MILQKKITSPIYFLIKRTLRIVPVGLALMIMALSLTAIAISFVTFGHLPGYASKILELQQKRLRQQYGLPPAHIVTDPKILQIPPSLRDMLTAYYTNPK
jgi:peptidoglycan/LPS O-acetylase OafA/YrhL